MTDIHVQATFTKTTTKPGAPATGLTLAEIDFYLYRVHRDTGVEETIWDGTQNPTAEVAAIGAYFRKYTGADLDTYTYHLLAEYTGATSLDTNWVTGAIGKAVVLAENLTAKPYVVSDGVGTPIEGVRVEIRQQVSGRTIWRGTTDVNGVPRDIFNNTISIDAGTYDFYRYHHQYSFDNPDVETVP
jgi:hypothetical protein